MKIFVANISHQLQETELNQLLTQYGQVISIKLATDPENGKRKGFAFVEMRDRAQAQKAIDGLNDLEIKGRKLSVKEDTRNEAPTSYNHPKRQRITKETDGQPPEIDGNRW